MEILYLIIGLVIGIVATWLICHFTFAAKKKDLVSSETLNELNEAKIAADTELKITKAQIEDEKKSRIAEKEQLQEKIDKLSENVTQLTADNSKLERELNLTKEQNSREAHERDERFKKQIELAQEQLKNASQELLGKRVVELQNSNSENLKNILDPLEKNLNDFKTRVNEIHDKNIETGASLVKELEQLKKMNENLGKEANDLTIALKGDVKTQGNWGEMLLEKQLELSGFIEGKHFRRQSYLKDENGLDIKSESGSKLQPDVVITLPNKTEIIVDSKVSLTAYVNYIGADNAAEQKQHLDLHLKSVKKHIDELAEKQYGKYNMGRSPECVMMFIPNESAYVAALKADSNLWGYAYSKKIILVGPSTIMATLNLTMDLWKREDQAANIKKIVDEATALYEKMEIFHRTFLSVGENLKTAQGNYDKAVKQLAEGNGNLLGRFEKMRQLGLSPKSKLPYNDTPELSE